MTTKMIGWSVATPYHAAPVSDAVMQTEYMDEVDLAGGGEAGTTGHWLRFLGRHGQIGARASTADVDAGTTEQRRPIDQRQTRDVAPVHIDNDDAARFRRKRWVRSVAVAAYVGAVVYRFSTAGVPFEREQVIAWLTGLVVVVSLLRPQPIRGALRTARDFGLLAVLLVAYDYTRGAAETLGMPVQIQTPINFDRALFPGDIPTVELQRWLAPFEGQRWWEIGVTLVYASHFVAPFAVTAALYIRDRNRWRAWISRYTTLTITGLIGYVLVPTMPPWLAARNGHIGDVERVSRRGWRGLDFEFAEYLFAKGQGAVNLFAAFPSLHLAYPLLIAAFFWSRAPWYLRPVLVAYPLAMAVSLVISGEHYVFDEVGSVVAVSGVMYAWHRLEGLPRVARWLRGEGRLVVAGEPQHL